MTGPLAKSLDEALLHVQANRPKLVKSKSVEIETKGGGYNIMFADLAMVADAILPMLADLGVLWQTWVDVITADGQFRRVLHWRLKHVQSGDEQRGMWPLAGENPQAIGSGITYGRRYCLVTATGLTPEDDDDAVAAEAERAAEAGANRGTARRAQADRRRPTPTGGTAQRGAQRPAAGRPPLPREGGGITNPQLQKLVVSLNEAGITERADKLELVQLFAGRPMQSSTEMTMQEAHTVFAAIEQAMTNPDPVGALWQAAAAAHGGGDNAAAEPPTEGGGT